MRLIYIVRRTEQHDPQPGAVDLDPGATAGWVILTVAFGLLVVVLVAGWIIATWYRLG
jgi:hypothetical protein